MGCRLRTLRLGCHDCHFSQSATHRSIAEQYSISQNSPQWFHFLHQEKLLRASPFNCCLLPLPFLFLLILLLNLCCLHSISLLCPKAVLLEDWICFCLSPTTSSYSILLPITFTLHLHFYFKWFEIPVCFCSLFLNLDFFNIFKSLTHEYYLTHLHPFNSSFFYLLLLPHSLLSLNLLPILLQLWFYINAVYVCVILYMYVCVYL